jgi:hypothetical protein
VTIRDAGGNDTLDLSGYNTPSVINLNLGSFSSAGGTFLDAIPLIDVVNAIGGNDQIIGTTSRTRSTVAAATIR